MQISDPDSRQPTTDSDFYLVGVGASAGGLEALEQMFQVMPANSGMSFVIVQHLSPDFRSLMDELLRGVPRCRSIVWKTACKCSRIRCT